MEKSDLWSEGNETVPDVQARVKELIKNLFMSMYNKTDEDGRRLIDFTSEDGDAGSLKAIRIDEQLNRIRLNVERGFYNRVDHIQNDVFKYLEQTRTASSVDSQTYVDCIELQFFFIQQRDELCQRGGRLMTPALSHTEYQLMCHVEADRKGCMMKKQGNDEEHVELGAETTAGYSSTGDTAINEVNEMNDDKPMEQTEPSDWNREPVIAENILDAEDGCTYYEQYHSPYCWIKLGDYVYVKNFEEKLIILKVLKIWTSTSGHVFINGSCLKNPEEIAHTSAREFHNREIVVTDRKQTVSVLSITGRCSILSFEDFTKCRFTEIKEEHVYLCRSKFIEAKNIVVRFRPLKGAALSEGVITDEIYFFEKQTLLPSKAHEVSHDQKPQINSGLTLEMTCEDDTSMTPIVTIKKGDDATEEWWKEQAFKNYICIMQGLVYMRDALVPFCHKIMSDFKSEMLNHLGVGAQECKSSTCSSANVVNGKLLFPCPNGLCDSLIDMIVQEHQSRKRPNHIFFANSKVQLLSIDLYELCKLYMGKGRKEDNRGLDQVDCAGLLQLVTGCRKFSVHIKNHVVEEVLRLRNSVMHLSCLSLNDDATEASFRVLANFVAVMARTVSGDKSAWNTLIRTKAQIKKLSTMEMEIMVKSAESDGELEEEEEEDNVISPSVHLLSPPSPWLTDLSDVDSDGIWSDKEASDQATTEKRTQNEESESEEPPHKKFKLAVQATEEADPTLDQQNQVGDRRRVSAASSPVVADVYE